MNDMDAIDSHIEALRLLKQVDKLFPDDCNTEFKKPLNDCIWQVWRDLDELLAKKKGRMDKRAIKENSPSGKKSKGQN